jgi:choline dehydrogenase-like flavoprotein
MIVSGREIDCNKRLIADAVIVGSGAGGATAAHLLSRAGLEVVILEEGGYFTTKDFSGTLSSLMDMVYRDAGLTPLLGRPNIAFAEGCCVGGSTVINGALCWRTPHSVLREWSVTGLPLLEDDILSPIFDKIEQDLSISIQEDKHDSNMISKLLVRGCQQLNWHYESVPRAQIDCENRNRCPTGCPSGAKQSMLVTYLPDAVSHGTRVYANARVVKIIRQGRTVKGVVALVGNGRRSHRLTVRAQRIFLAGGTIQTPYLLLKNGFRHRIGRDLRVHFNLKAVAVFKEEINPHIGTMMTAQVKEFADEHIYIGGSNFDPVYLALTLAPHGTGVVQRLSKKWRHTGIYLAQVRCSGTGRVVNSRMGRPLPVYMLKAEDIRRIRRSLRNMVRVLLAAGAAEIYLPIGGSPVVRRLEDSEAFLSGSLPLTRTEILAVHAMGACPMGTDTRSSALDEFGRLHGTDNVFVSDASILPGATGVNPQVSIMAMVHRNILAILNDRRYAL